MIRVLYFGVLKETLGLEQEELEWSQGTTAGLLTLLSARGEIWAEALAPGKVFRLVVNQQMVRGDVAISDGAEVGILPPVTGG
jgi:molybdopterin synthase sulfur carrier subunit